MTRHPTRMRGASLPLWIAGLTLLVLLLGPLLIPVPPLEDTVEPYDLGDADSQWANIDGVDIHYKHRGRGRPVLLLHGFGASLFSWRELFDRLSADMHVIAYDRPGFGLTERPLSWVGSSPYGPDKQPDIALGVLDQTLFDTAKVVLVGHSAGAALAMDLASRQPERFSRLVLIAPAIVGSGGPPQWMKNVFWLPQVDRLGPLMTRGIGESGVSALRMAWHDPTRLTADVIEGYRRPLRARDWDVGLWEFAKASRSLDPESLVKGLTLPTLVVTGDDDRLVPTASTVALAEHIPNASLAVIDNCGHAPQEECPQAFIDALRGFLE